MKGILDKDGCMGMREGTDPGELQAAKSGSEVELAAIMARYMPVIRRAARRAAGPGLDFEDAVQEGIIGLFSAIQSYGEDRGASFSTYAAVCINNAAASAKKAAGRKKHAPLNQSVPISDEQSIPGPEDAAIANEQVQVTMKKARTVLSAMEKSVLRLYLDGYSYIQIAKRLGVNEKAVENALGRVRKKLR